MAAAGGERRASIRGSGWGMHGAAPGVHEERPYIDFRPRLFGRVCTVWTTEMLRMAKAASQ